MKDANRSTRASQLSKLLSPIKHGSIRASVYNLCTLAIGAGCLALPYALSLAGIIPGIILILSGASIALWSLGNLVNSSANKDCTNYLILCNIIVGNWFGILMEIAMTIYLIGVVILFQIMGNNMTKHSK